MFFSPQTLHFTGIGGIGMSALAQLARAAGCAVSGSDLKLSPVTNRLAGLGIAVFEGHSADNLPAGATALVVTSAASPDNPEVMEARRRGVPIVTRGELLAEMMQRHRGVAVAGSHGKTTTSSLLAAIAVESGIDPTVAIGALVPALNGSNARLGQGPWMIAEADESDGSFLELHPEFAILTNIDREHLDHYGSFDAARAAFARFVNQVSLTGAIAVCADDAEAMLLVPSVRRRIILYGRSAHAYVQIVDESSGPTGSTFTLVRDGNRLGDFTLPLLGSHNVLNAAGAVCIALAIGIGADVIQSALAHFRGPSRRMEIKGIEQGVTVIDDYGHHPTEIRATLKALRLLRPTRLIVLFQPHRYTRTQALLDEFAGAFADADSVRVLDVYAASETPIDGITGQSVAARIAASGHPDAVHVGSLSGAVASVLVELRPGDLVLTQGAGNITQAGEMILKGLRKEEIHGETP